MRHDIRYLKLLSTLALFEAASFIMLLGVAMPLKYINGDAPWVTLMGALHGFVWLLYIWLIIAMASLKMWRGRELLRLIVSTLVPFAGFANARWLAGLVDELRSSA